MDLYIRQDASDRALRKLRKNLPSLDALEREHERDLDAKKNERERSYAKLKTLADGNARRFKAKREREQRDALRG